MTVADVPEFFANGILAHNCDAARYGYTDLTHYLAKLPGDKPKAGTREALQLEAERIESQIDEQEQRRAAALADGDEMTAEYGGMYGWQ